MNMETMNWKNNQIDLWTSPRCIGDITTSRKKQMANLIFIFLGGMLVGSILQAITTAVLQVRRERKLDEQKKLQALQDMMIQILAERKHDEKQ